MRILTSLILFVTLVTNVYAKKIGDVEIPDSIQVAGQTDQLVLNGAGIRSKLFFDIYVSGLYLPAKQDDAKTILAASNVKRVSMNIVYSEISKKKMNAGWQDGIEDNVEGKIPAGLQEQLDGFKALFPDLQKGDVVWLDFIPGTGTRVTINKVEKGVVSGDDFATALLKIWIGKHPVGKKLKQQMLGLK